MDPVRRSVRTPLESPLPRLKAGLVMLLLLAMAGCGYVGDPLPPALYIPLPVKDLRAVQVGGEIGLQFTLPARTTEDLAVDEVQEVDLRLAGWENRGWDEAAWEREATRLSTLPVEERTVTARTPAGPWEGKRVLLRARVAGRSGRYSAWSDPVPLRVIPALPPPPGFEVASAAEGVRVSWELPAQSPQGLVTEVFRRPAETAQRTPDFSLVTRAEGTEWLDRDARFGERYVYRVRSRVEGDERNAMSLFSPALAIAPEDTFAPAVPADVAAVAGAVGTELSWTRNMEPDFQTYRVYRSVNGSEFSPIGEPTATPTFSDPSAPTGTPLRYRVTAVDTKGNESAPSAPVELTLP